MGYLHYHRTMLSIHKNYSRKFFTVPRYCFSIRKNYLRKFFTVPSYCNFCNATLHFVLFSSYLRQSSGMPFFSSVYFLLLPCFRSESMSSRAFRILEQLGISAVRNSKRLEKLGIVSMSQ